MEAILLHTDRDKKQAYERAVEMLKLVNVNDPEKRMKQYPFEFSGGMRQRVVIAIALACRPQLIIADEPTTALDVTIQAQVLELMKQLKQKFAASMILITHDLGIVADICDKVAIMYAGRVVEYASTQQLFEDPRHPYTEGLFNSLPDIEEEQERLKVIQGLMPDPTNLPSGCCFHPRCPYAVESCSVLEPAMFEAAPGHFSACPVRGGNGR